MSREFLAGLNDPEQDSVQDLSHQPTTAPKVDDGADDGSNAPQTDSDAAKPGYAPGRYYW